MSPEECLDLSAYLDDRHLAALAPETLLKILKGSEDFERLANGALNPTKAQLYGTPAVNMATLTEYMPSATCPDRVWSLGFALPACQDDGDINMAKH